MTPDFTTFIRTWKPNNSLVSVHKHLVQSCARNTRLDRFYKSTKRTKQMIPQKFSQNTYRLMRLQKITGKRISNVFWEVKSPSEPEQYIVQVLLARPIESPDSVGSSLETSCSCKRLEPCEHRLWVQCEYNKDLRHLYAYFRIDETIPVSRLIERINHLFEKVCDTSFEHYKREVAEVGQSYEHLFNLSLQTIARLQVLSVRAEREIADEMDRAIDEFLDKLPFVERSKHLIYYSDACEIGSNDTSMKEVA
jgi:hypothetical protein